MQPFDFPQAAVLLLAPLVRHALEERRIDEPVELIDVHGVNALIEPLVFGLMAPDRLLVLAALVGVACVQRLAHPFEHLVVEPEPAEQLGELRFERLLAHMLAPAGGRVPLALIGVAGAMVIDVALFLNLADHRAAASRTGDQARERKVVPPALGLLGEAAVEHALYVLPQLDRDQRLVLALYQLAVPFEPAGIEPVAQNGVDGAHRHLGAAPRVNEACGVRLARRFLQRNVAARVPLEQFGDQRRDRRIGGDDLLAVRPGDVAIAERAFGRPDALLGLLLHALARFLGQVVDVVLRHQHLDAVHEFFRGTRFAREHDAFLGEVQLHVEFVHRYPILEIAIEPVRFFDQHHANRRMRLEIGNHLTEGSAACLLGRFHVHIFLCDHEAVGSGVFLQKLQLRWDGEAFLLLLLGGDAGIDHRLAVGGIDGGGTRRFLHIV